MAGYVSAVKKDIARWESAGLIDAATAAALARDIEVRSVRRVSFGPILSILASALLVAALLLLVAANWEAIPRLVRVGMIVAIMLAGYVGGAVLKTRGSDVPAESLWILAAAAFGTPLAALTLIDGASLKLKASIGLEQRAMPVEESFAAQLVASMGTIVPSRCWITSVS